jgi:hypothetical protein
LIAVSVAYLGPLIYISNREIIDEQIAEVQKLINAQANQAKELANQHTSRATGLVKQYANEYSSKAQGYIGSRHAAAPVATKVSAANPEPVSPPKFETTDFPEAPKTEPVAAAATPETEPAASTESQQEPLLAL